MSKKTANATPEERAAIVDRLIAGEVHVPIAKVIPTANLREDLGFDSLDVVELVMELEKEFEIDISDPESETLHTVADLHTLIRNRVS